MTDEWIRRKGCARIGEGPLLYVRLGEHTDRSDRALLADVPLSI